VLALPGTPLTESESVSSATTSISSTVSVIVAAVTALAVLPAAVTVAQPTTVTNQFKNIPVTGTVTEPGGGAFEGLLDINEFQVQGDRLVAVGVLRGTLTRPNAAPQDVPPTPIVWPVQSLRSGPAAQGGEGPDDGTFMRLAQPAPACDILHLVLGPLDLNLLGLRVQLNQVLLDITAEPGPGNLLGNLLCAIVGLLDPGGNLPGVPALLQQIADLLNRIIGIIGV
jgi:hypothetical protein